MNYYELNADVFFNETVNLSMDEVYQYFLPLVCAGGEILDAGCGSGRDSKAFLECGFKVHAIDCCSELAWLASGYIGQDVDVMSFEDIRDLDRYDGIWACASLLHTPEEALPAVVGVLSKSLKQGCPMYASFKYGDIQTDVDGRKFTNLNEESIQRIIGSDMDIKMMWLTGDERQDKAHQKWINVILVKR